MQALEEEQWKGCRVHFDFELVSDVDFGLVHTEAAYQDTDGYVAK